MQKMNQKTIEQRVKKLKEYIFHSLAGPISSKLTTYNLQKKITLSHYELELPIDFREIERQIGFIDIGINDYVIFSGKEPYIIGEDTFSPSQKSNEGKYLYLGTDVDGICYAYNLNNKKNIYMVHWFIADEPKVFNEVELEACDRTFLEVLEDRIYTYLK